MATRMSRQVRQLGVALALGFAGGVAAPIVVYFAVLHLGGPRAEARPVQELRLEMESSTPPVLPVLPAVAPVTKAARHPARKIAAAEPAEITVPRANPGDLGRHIPSVPDAPH